MNPSISPESFQKVFPRNKQTPAIAVQAQDNVNSQVVAHSLSVRGMDAVAAIAIKVPSEMVMTRDTPLHAHNDIMANAKSV